jgi:hypothetical protein
MWRNLATLLFTTDVICLRASGPVAQIPEVSRGCNTLGGTLAGTGKPASSVRGAG